MNFFTRYESKESKEQLKAFYWDGSYDLYRRMVRFDPDFVAILDDGGQKGKDSIKIWNDANKVWETCLQGDYVVKKNDKVFTVKSRDEIISKFRRV